MTDPQPFYVVTKEDRRKVPLRLVHAVDLPGGQGYSSRRLGLPGRTVDMTMPMVDLGGGLAAVPATFRIPRPGAAAGVDGGAIGIAFDAWTLSDYAHDRLLPLMVTVDNPHGPAFTDYVRRYVAEARHLDASGARLWGDRAVRIHEAWRSWRAREGVDA